MCTGRVAATITTTTASTITTIIRLPAVADVHGLLPLLTWLSPAFPVGAYAYSHGLEWAVEAGDVRDEPSLTEWLSDLLLHGAGRNDAILLCAAHRATAARDETAFAEANDLALALAPSRELRLETSQQGRSFIDAVATAWPRPEVSEIAARLDEIAYPVAVGCAAAAHGIALAPVVQGYLMAFCQNMVSAALRLAPIGQTGGTRVLAGLAPVVERLAEYVLVLDLEDVGGATFRADLGSFRHETQYTRLFRS